MNLGEVAEGEHDDEMARSYYEEMLAIARAKGMKWATAQAMFHIGNVAFRQHDYVTAEAMYRESLASNREVGSLSDVAMLFSLLARVDFSQGNDEGAANFLKESLRFSDKGAYIEANCSALETSAALASAHGLVRHAARLFGAVEGLCTSLNPQFAEPFEQERYQQAIVTTRAQLDEATFNAAWAEGRALSLEQAIALALEDSDREEGSEPS